MHILVHEITVRRAMHHVLISECVCVYVLDVRNQKPAHSDSPGATRGRWSGGYDTARVSKKITHM